MIASSALPRVSSRARLQSPTENSQPIAIDLAISMLAFSHDGLHRMERFGNGNPKGTGVWVEERDVLRATVTSLSSSMASGDGGRTDLRGRETAALLRFEPVEREGVKVALIPIGASPPSCGSGRSPAAASPSKYRLAHWSGGPRRSECFSYASRRRMSFNA